VPAPALSDYGKMCAITLRQLSRNPAFTWTAVITLGLGIGATTSIFSAVYALLVRPLPYRSLTNWRTSPLNLYPRPANWYLPSSLQRSRV